MPAIIKGRVFDDLNNNTIYDGNEPGIKDVIVILYDGESCIKVSTDINGVYTFTVAKALTYTIYETVDNVGDVCPPVECSQPKGYTVSNTKRKSKITINQAQIDANLEVKGFNFGHANIDFVDCNTFGLQIANGSLYYINMITGESTFKGTPGEGNALAYEANSEKLFYIRNGDVLRINGDMSTTRLDSFQGSIIATMDEKGRMLMPSGGSIVWKNMNQNSVDFLEEGIISVNGTIQVQADWTYNPVDKQIHTSYQTIDVSTNVATITQVTYMPPIHGGVGAAFSDRDGFDYWLQNSTGNIVRSFLNSKTEGESILFSKTVTASTNDGASCIYASLSPDFGDCPDLGTLPLSFMNYRTLLSKNGPRHAYDKRLVLGTDLSQEPEAKQNQTATGDDFDDGVNISGLKIQQNDKNVKIKVNVSNKTGVLANLYGWIDFNKNGIFEGDEASDVVLVSSDVNINPREFFLNFNINRELTRGNTFLRIRLTTEDLKNRNSVNEEDTRSYGAAKDGEVEDYEIEILGFPNLSIEKSVDKSVALIGETILYTFTVKNIGNLGATNISITDTLPKNSFLFEESSGNSLGATTLTLSIPNLNVGESFTKTFKVKGISLLPTNELVNEGVLKYNSELYSDITTYGTISNTVITKLLPLKPIEIVKYVDKKYADLGDIITYTITMKNPNIIDTVDNIFKDTIPIGTTFINNSFTNDNVNLSGNVEEGILIGNILAMGIKTVTFKIKINDSF